MSKNQAQTVWQSAANIVIAVQELQALVEEVYQQLEKVDEFNIFCTSQDNRDDGNGWFSYAHSQSATVSLKSRGKRKIGAVTFSYSLWHENEHETAASASSWKHAQLPKIYVGFSPSHDDTWDIDQMYLLKNGSPNQKEVSPFPPFLWEWKEDQEYEELANRSWFFCVEMFEINSPEDVDKKLINPFVQLLRGASQEEAFKGVPAISSPSFD